VNETQGAGYGQTSFYALSISHNVSSTTSLQKTAAPAIRGDAGDNTLRGKAGADIFYSGSGNDVLYGDRGKDVFVFDTKLGTSKTDRKINFDTIKDFGAAADAIWLDNKIFTTLGKGTLTKPAQLQKGFFAIDSQARDTDDYVLYDRKSGVLSYDPDASGSKAPLEFAQLKKGAILTYKDLFVV
jgi:Ca2+-binding RTX toxin-like protein